MSGITISRYENLGSLMYGFEILGIMDNDDPDVHCEH
jgi:hypothetical protein